MLSGVEASFAQDTIDNSIQQKLEDLAESSQSEDADYTNLLEMLTYYRQHPINLNNTNTVELSELGLLNAIQIENLLEHIDKNGKLISLYEIQSINGFDIQTIEKIRPYIKVADVTDKPHASLKEILLHGNNEFVLRGEQVIEKEKGFAPIDSAGIIKNPNSRYIGSQQKIYSHYRFKYGNNISLGITAEKDPGELFFLKNNKFNYPGYDSLLKGKQKNGFDFYSAHIFVKNIRFIKTLAIGDYQLSFGQGLTMWTGLAYGKNSDAVAIKRNALGIRPYTSVDENRFMRGAAFTAGNNTFQATGFFSRKKMDANVIGTDSLNSDQVTAVSSLQETGLHTTPAEISDKGSITQTIVGGNLSYRKRKYSFGITGMHTMFDAVLNRTLEPYSQFAFNGKELTNLGADYSILIHNFNFFGEAAVSPPSKGGVPALRDGGFAFLNGCIISLDPKLSFAILQRNFQRNYQTLSANVFAESSVPVNEQGFYFGINAKPANSVSINAFYDHFTFPWLKYQVNAPSNGNEFLVQVNYTPSKKVETYVRIRQKDKFINDNSMNEIDFITPYKQTNYRWHIGYQISPSFKLSNRIEYITLDKNGNENGYLVYQDVTYKKAKSKISFTLRYALFDTKSYNSRIYAYENDIPGSYSIPSYYNKGSRMYILINYHITRSMEILLRCSQTYYSNQSVISPGTLNEIDGHTKTEVKAELRMRF